MKIILSDAGKRFNREWIFRHLDFQFLAPHKYAITGPNGSGKSTLLQFIAGALMPTEGKLGYFDQNDQPVVAPYQLISIAAPYLDVIEEMTAMEFFQFHETFKPLLPDHNILQILEIVGLEQAAEKQIRYYSSGMKQRVKLAQAFFSHTPVVLLDEPTTNLDVSGIALYHHLIDQYCRNRLVIVSSNDAAEYSFCDTIMDMKNPGNVQMLSRSG